MPLDTTPILLLLAQLRQEAERMAGFGSPTSPGPESHPSLRPVGQPDATPQEKAAWAARARGRFAQEQTTLLADFTAACKALGCADPAGFLGDRNAEDFGARSEAVKREVVELFRLAAAGPPPSLVAKMSGLKLDWRVAAGVRLASRALSAEAERRGRQRLQGRDLSLEKLSVADKAIIEALRRAGGAALRGEPLAGEAGYSHDYVRQRLPGLVRRGLVEKTGDGYTLPRD
jgi:uncharacterized membrane protein